MVVFHVDVDFVGGCRLFTPLLRVGSLPLRLMRTASWRRRRESLRVSSPEIIENITVNKQDR